MFYAAITEEECFAFFAGQLASDQLKLVKADSAEALPRVGYAALLLWKTSDQSAENWPDAVFLGKRFKRDFLAWTHTYLTGHSPIGAFLHILDDEFLPVFFGEQRRQSRNVERLIAVPAAESLTNIDARDDAIGLPSVLCRSCSFAAIRAIAIGYSWDGVARAIENWAAIRSILNLPEAKIDVSTMKLVFAIAHAVSGDLSAERFVPKTGATALRMLKEYASSGNISNSSWLELTARLNDAPSQALLSEGPRESRVPLVQRLLAGAMEFPERDNISVACFLGYVINQLAPGTFEHTSILRRFAGTHPSALLWYGLFAGFYKNGGLKGYFSTTGAAMLRREITRPAGMPGAPVCDITADEIYMMYEANKSVPRLRGLMPNQITVSVLSGVDVPIRTTAKDQHEASVPFDQRPADQRIKQVLNVMESKLAQTQALVESLRMQLREFVEPAIFERSERSPQPELFPRSSEPSARRGKKGRIS